MIDILSWFDFREVLMENLPGIAGIVLFTVLLHFFFLRLEREFLKLLLKGLVLVVLGLVLFLQGVNIGLVPAGEALAAHLGAHERLNWLIIPLAFILGLVITWAEPAVNILCSQVEEATSGFVRSTMMRKTISLGVAFFAALGTAQILVGFPLQYILIPGYLLVLGMMLFCSRLFIGIAFDSCTVSTGPMVITFVMAMALGLATVLEGRDPMLDGFGLVAVIALAPIVSVMITGIIFTKIAEIRS